MSRRQVIAVVVLTVAVISGGVAATLGTTADAERGPATQSSDQQAVDRFASAALQNQTTNASSVTFENQTSNGSAVTIANVTVPDGGFVVVHDRELLNGSVLDSVLGASAYLEPGTHENVTVTFDEQIEADQLLLAVTYRDTNGNETFEFVRSQGEADSAYVVENQVVIDDAAVTVEAQSAETTTEVVETTTEVAETTEQVETTEEPAETTTEELPTTTEVSVETTTAVETTEVSVETTTEDVETTTVAETTTDEPTETTTAVETTTPAEPALLVSNVVSPRRIDVDGGSLVVNAQVENPSDRAVTETVQLRVNGTVVQERPVTVAAGETVAVQFEVSTSELEPGLNYVGVLTRDFGEIVRVTGTEITNETTTAY
ncbi:DUF7282 domain-containing protein [Halorussus halophilus]|uniref:DUF7282 domain-containing protein n=1 Tax=Halorussus halophilus TaxID=2650975 RepID=UPI0013011C02|nr:hypothetical protein [Halorussus halophilus]